MSIRALSALLRIVPRDVERDIELTKRLQQVERLCNLCWARWSCRFRGQLRAYRLRLLPGTPFVVDVYPSAEWAQRGIVPTSDDWKTTMRPSALVQNFRLSSNSHSSGGY